MSKNSVSQVYKSFAKRVRNRRKSLLLNQKSLAKKLGVTEDRYERIESGHELPGKREMMRLTMELRTSEDWLLNGGY